jgi:hypothetical protein
MFDWCCVSDSFFVKIPNHILFSLSPVFLFEGMLCFPVVWPLYNMESIVFVFLVL